MAKLETKSVDFSINLTLYPDPNSYKWVTYEIIIGPRNGDKNLSLCLSYDEDQYFDACYDQEVLSFCYGIEQVLKEEKDIFFFEPADQEDFQFIIRKKIMRDFEIIIYSDFFTIPKDYNCPSYICRGTSATFTKEEILDFISQLKKEYEEIISKYPKDPNCTR